MMVDVKAPTIPNEHDVSNRQTGSCRNPFILNPNQPFEGQFSSFKRRLDTFKVNHPCKYLPYLFTISTDAGILANKNSSKDHFGIHFGSRRSSQHCP